jgi:hypothetical protein
MGIGVPELIIISCICGLLLLVLVGGLVAVWVFVIRPKTGKQP